LRVRVEYRGTLERGDAVELASAVTGRDDGRELAVWLAVDRTVRVSATVTVRAPEVG
jgi:hypothetical protein